MRSFEMAKSFAIQESHQARRGGWFNLCQKFSRQCVGAGPFGTTARLAFNGTPAGHRFTTSPPPAGSIAYYGRPDQGAGHAVFAVEGGRVWSNDILRKGQIDRVAWDVFRRRWGLAYRGWIDWCPSGPLSIQKPDAGSPAGFRQARRVYQSKMRFNQDDSNSVWNLQTALMIAGFKFIDGPTGNYGHHTRKACRQFQLAQGWSGRDADGIAGPQTVRRLGLIWAED